jgi:integrase
MISKGVLPCHREGAQILFSPEIVRVWLQNDLGDMKDETYLKRLEKEFKAHFPESLEKLQKLDARFSKGPKYYNLVKIPNKKYGFLYYVRYTENGRPIHSKWNTHTNDIESAERFARDNRESILAAYHERKKRKPCKLYAILREYYKKDSPFLETARKRGRLIGDRTRITYERHVLNVFIPFLKRNAVKTYEDISPQLITKYQNYLLEKGDKPQTISRYLGGIKAIFDYLVMSGFAHENIMHRITTIRQTPDSQFIRGCYETDEIKGIFNKRWENQLFYILCLVIYTTGMRNSEIEKMQSGDIISTDDINFISIKTSKTINGIRRIPLHPFTCRKIKQYIQKTKRKPDDYLFSKDGTANQSVIYREANNAMGALLGMSPGILAEKKITFYSGRYFWKTLMNAHSLGEVEEYFMGHKVSKDVSKRYNHLDKQGKRKLLEKAREVFRILDAWVFK